MSALIRGQPRLESKRESHLLQWMRELVEIKWISSTEGSLATCGHVPVHHQMQIMTTQLELSHLEQHMHQKRHWSRRCAHVLEERPDPFNMAAARYTSTVRFATSGLDFFSTPVQMVYSHRKKLASRMEKLERLFRIDFPELA